MLEPSPGRCLFVRDQRIQSQQSSLHHVYQLSHKIQKLIRIMFEKSFAFKIDGEFTFSYHIFKASYVGALIFGILFGAASAELV